MTSLIINFINYKSHQVGFSINYRQNSSNDDTVFLVVYITINIFAVVYSFFELGALRRREGLKYVDGKVC